MNPEDFLKYTQGLENRLTDLKNNHVAVGLPIESVSGKIYGNGITVVEVGSFHEYGTDNIPQRSFLRLPFTLKKNELDTLIKSLYKKIVEEGLDVQKALKALGIEATNISSGAFRSNGYGSWEPVKHGGTPLIDTGTLRNSITYIVRKGK